MNDTETQNIKYIKKNFKKINTVEKQETLE